MANFKRCNWRSNQFERRRNADVLTAERAARSDEQQLTLLDSRPGNSVKERARLIWRIEDSKNIPTAPTHRRLPRKRGKGGAK